MQNGGYNVCNVTVPVSDVRHKGKESKDANFGALYALSRALPFTIYKQTIRLFKATN
jgi:hypothetical protein